jgi:hypothetical protein
MSHNAAAEKNNHKIDTPVKNAQLDSSKMFRTPKDVSDQPAQDNTRSSTQLMRIIVEDVKIANGHNLCQTQAGLNVLKDHWLLATV